MYKNRDNKKSDLPYSLSKINSLGKFAKINNDNVEILREDNINMNSFKIYDKNTNHFKNLKIKCQDNKLNPKFFSRDKSKEILKLNKVDKCKTRSVTSLKTNSNVQKLFSDYESNQ